MKPKLILFLLLIYFANCSGENKTCGNYTCFESRGECMYNAYCSCEIQYETYPLDSKILCNYVRKKQLIAFFLELLIMFGAGHFYVEKYYIGIPKLILWIISIISFSWLRYYNLKKEENHPNSIILSIIGLILFSSMVLWQLFDIVLYTLNKYSDGNNIELLSWT